MRTLLAVLFLLPVWAIQGAAWGAGSGYRLDRSPHDLTDTVSLQSGAATYMNYCLGCHGL